MDFAPLIPAKVYKDLEPFRNNRRQIKRYMKSNFSASFLLVDGKDVTVSGEFDDDKELITITASLPKRMTDKQWAFFKSELIITMMHEYVHAMQYYNSGSIPDLVLLHKESKVADIEEDREYYSTWIEIQAYAHCILCEFKNNNPKKTCIEQIRAKRCTSPTLSRYRKVFNGFDYPIRYLYREILRWERRYENLNNR
jgi:hypothetical protein